MSKEAAPQLSNEVEDYSSNLEIARFLFDGENCRTRSRCAVNTPLSFIRKPSGTGCFRRGWRSGKSGEADVNDGPN
jgi:hypothetical protein